MEKRQTVGTVPNLCGIKNLVPTVGIFPPMVNIYSPFATVLECANGKNELGKKCLMVEHEKERVGYRYI